LLLRPIGQELIAIAYSKFSNEEKGEFRKKLKKIDFNLSHHYWKYIFWNNKMLGKELRLKKGIILKLMGKPIIGYNVDKEMKRVYRLYNENFDFSIKPL
jgi:DNA sulfur modification protein DndB